MNTMEDKCPRCNWTIHDLALSPVLEQQLYDLIRRGEKMRFVQLLYRSLDIDLVTAKEIMVHQNFDYGVCVRCGYEQLNQERICCPNCQAFNYNLNFQTTAE